MLLIMKNLINFRHTCIVVSDVNKSIDFYVNLLGLKLELDKIEKNEHIDQILKLEKCELRIIKLSLNNIIVLELFKFYSHNDKKKVKNYFDYGCNHIAFTVKDIDMLYKKLLDHNVYFNSKPLLSPDKSVKYVFCNDPDDTPIELVEVL